MFELCLLQLNVNIQLSENNKRNTKVKENNTKFRASHVFVPHIYS